MMFQKLSFLKKHTLEWSEQEWINHAVDKRFIA